MTREISKPFLCRSIRRANGCGKRLDTQVRQSEVCSIKAKARGGCSLHQPRRRRSSLSTIEIAVTILCRDGGGTLGTSSRCGCIEIGWHDENVRLLSGKHCAQAEEVPTFTVVHEFARTKRAIRHAVQRGTHDASS